MKVLREVYDFVTGGSVAAPIGLLAAAAIAYVCAARAGWAEAAGFALLGTLVVTFVASVLEGARS